MNYEILRRILFDAISMTDDHRVRVKPCYHRLENRSESKESLHKIVKDFERHEIGRRKYIVEIENKTYEVVLHNVADKSTSGIRVKSHDDAVKAGKLKRQSLCRQNQPKIIPNTKDLIDYVSTTIAWSLA